MTKLTISFATFKAGLTLRVHGTAEAAPCKEFAEAPQAEACATDRRVLVSVSLQDCQRKITVRGFAPGGIVVGMAFEAARFRGFDAGVVAGAARGDAGQQHVGTLLAARCCSMA